MITVIAIWTFISLVYFVYIHIFFVHIKSNKYLLTLEDFILLPSIVIAHILEYIFKR